MKRYKSFKFEEEFDQIDTPEFKKWFKGSKVTKGGKPLVVYHGSKSDFNTFDLDKTGSSTDTGMWGKGFYFTDDESYSKRYGKVRKVYLSIKNPYYIKHKNDIPDIKVPNETMEDLRNSDKNYSIIFRDSLKKKGYDGVIVTLSGLEIVAFYPNQIKSATDNNGEFSLHSNNIYESQFNEEFDQRDYLKWKKANVTYRGMKKIGVDNEVYGSFGKGLYTAPLSNKAMAKTYGDLYFVVNAIPKKPKIVNSLNDAEIVRQGLVANFCKKNNVDYNLSFFEKNTSMDKEMLKLGFDGLIIKGREMVHYNPKNVLYFKTEDGVKNYYASL